MVVRRIGLLVLASVLVIGAIDASPLFAQQAPTPPTQPTEGPGAEPTAFSAARSMHYGSEPGGFWIIEPELTGGKDSPVASAPLPVILYLSGCCGIGGYPDPDEVSDWTAHLARSGFIVIAPVYTSSNAMPDLFRLLPDGMKELERPGHATPDYEQFGVIGFSFGGAMAVNYAGLAANRQLPVPKALFLDAPCEGSVIPGCVPLYGDFTLPPDLKATVLVYSGDFVVGSEPAKVLWEALSVLPAENRDFITMTTDNHGSPSIIANHGTTYIGLNAADWYGLWKLSTGLFTCAFTGTFCEYALGNTPEQTSMGAWSDGIPVTPLLVTDDPNTSPAASASSPA